MLENRKVQIALLAAMAIFILVAMFHIGGYAYCQDGTAVFTSPLSGNCIDPQTVGVCQLDGTLYKKEITGGE